jgi:peptidoglycan/LPS O-acetylase OafA/YrhL
MAQEDPRLRSYRTFLVVLLLVGGLLALGVGGWLLAHGHRFYAFLAMCVLGLFMLLVHGYRQEEQSREQGEDR